MCSALRNEHQRLLIRAAKDLIRPAECQDRMQISASKQNVSSHQFLTADPIECGDLVGICPVE